MRRHLTTTLAALALSLVFCSSAIGAVSFGFSEAQHKPTTINKGDEIVGYTVKLKNEGTTTTSGATIVSVSLPGGVKLAFGSGTGWSCHVNSNLCTSNQAVVGGAEFNPLSLEAWIYPAEAPQTTITATFSAFGGGATGPDAIGQESFTLGPEKLFDFETFSATAEDEAGADYEEAGGHPFSATTSFSIPTHITSLRQASTAAGHKAPVENLRDAHFELPAGFIGNPETAGICAFVQVSESTCPDSAAVGGVEIEFAGEDPEHSKAIFRIVPEEGYAAAFAFRPVSVSAVTVVLRAKLRSNGDYGVTAIAPLPPQSPAVTSVNFATFCGYGAKVTGIYKEFGGCRTPGEPGANEIPFLTNPTRCAGPVPVTVGRIDSYQQPGRQTVEGFPDLSDPRWKSQEDPAPATTGCEALSEAWVGVRKPSFGFRPDNTRAAAPASYSANLHIPQDGLLEASGLATAHLKDTTVTLPAGIALNPSAAAGLGACSLEQAGYLGNHFPAPNPIHFSTVAAGCPDNSKVATVKVTTPILAKALPGSVYLAAQDANPFGSKFAIYLVIDDKETGIKATLAGRVSPDPVSGRITTVFANNPQAPIEDVDLSFFGGPRASLSNPDVCAPYTTRTELTPWSAADPDHPTAAETAVSEDTVAIDAPAEGQASCPATKAQRPFALGFTAGTTNPLAGAHTPFTLRITRPAGSQELSGISVTSPPGFAATLKGVAICSEAAVAAAGAPGRTGKAELATPSCPASSQVGTTTVGAGAGPTPFYVKSGRVYLTGPYKGAPLSFTFIVPAVAGPFDLGVQVVRTALNVDPRSAQVTAVSDPIPQILEGVPLNIRDIRVDLDRPNFALNPTNCEAMAIAAKLTGSSGAVANLTNRFQVAGCEKLKFKPNLKIQLHGGTKRGDYQRLEGTVSYPEGPGYANIARAAVTLPHSSFLAQEHINTVCTRVQFAAKQCPKGSIYGHAEGTTPLLDGKISGPVYLRSSSNPLPDMVAALRGPDAQPIEIELVGRVDSKNGGIRNTFDLVPDAPVSKFKLELFGGKKSLIVNSRDLCKGTQRATVRLTAQNGMRRNTRPAVGNDCGRKKKKGTSGKKGRR